MRESNKNISIKQSSFKLQLLFVVVFICSSLVSFPQDVKVSRLTVARPAENAFGAFVHENTMYYCINRGKKSTKRNENQGGSVFLDLFTIEMKQKNKTLGKPMRLSDTLNSNQNEGPVQISKNGEYLFYSKNLDTNKDTTENKLGIFISKSVGGGWGVPASFPYNNDNYSVSNPTVNVAMDMMIFSSDMKDGYGRSDLYVSYKQDEVWTEPVNLGAEVNTKWGESFPYLIGTSLYFTSSREGGIGGLDIYVSKFKNDKWQKPTILAEPLNSKLDDFCYFLNDDGKSGYFSSNRGGVSDGVYYFEKKIPEPIIFHNQDVQFCHVVTDILMEETEDLEFTWDMGDGTTLKGLSVEHCYQDTGTFVTRFSVYEKSMDRNYFSVATSQIKIDPQGIPFIEYELEDGQYNFSINNKWTSINYDGYYWMVDDEKVFKATFSYPSDKLKSIRLVVWNKKNDDSAKGIELLLEK